MLPVKRKEIPAERVFNSHMDAEAKLSSWKASLVCQVITQSRDVRVVDYVDT